MQKHIELTRQRAQKFAEKLPALFYSHHAQITLSVYHAPGRITYKQAVQAGYVPAAVGEKLGPLWSTHWFRLDFQIPPAWEGQEVHLLWDSASEACLWQDGAPLQGLTGSFNGWQAAPIHTEFIVTRQARGGEAQTCYIEAACNGLFGIDNQAHNPRIGELSLAEVAVFDRDAWDLYWDLKVIADMALYLPANTPRGGQALYTANEMVNTILLEDKSSWLAARQIASRFLTTHNGGGQHNLSAVGHAHIDTAWLWPIAETKRKSARSFSTAVRLMDAYPEYKFACSQAQQFAWMKAEYPTLYERMQEKARAGQFVPTGGTWVEPDCNIPSGESLVRQFLYGQRFFEKEFGARCSEFWNPDVFGYSGALPQIMKLAGIDFFLTQKLSWNQFNKPASHTFLWEGIDGSRVLTHFPPADTYNSLANVREVLYNVSNFKDHERANESYLLFGYGDGGGGPTPAMLEQLRRMEDVDGLPRTQIRSPREFFERCAADLRDPLVQSGELYFELHRGTYTTQARNKRFNRQSELLLREAEMLGVLALAVHGQPYPAAELETLWKIVLTNQFHDIIPGSSIGEVYQDSTRDYQAVLKKAGELRQKSLDTLLAPVASTHLTPDTATSGASFPLTPDTSTPGTFKTCAFNSLGFPRSEVVELPGPVPGAQKSASGRDLGLVSAPALGYTVQAPAAALDSVHITETAGGFSLENGRLQATLNRQGGLTSLFHKTAGREVIQPGAAGNTFVLYEDLPNAWEAWDVDVFHLEKKLPLPGASSARVLESGPLRAAVEFEYILSPRSRLRQIVSLDALATRLDFACQADWHEKQKFLKVEFPLNLRSAFATFEIQFGHVQRPTHFNTSLDLARFEVPAQRWADLSEPDFGAALINDCKYGYAAHDNILRLSLLRAPIYPDPDADQGQHEFRFAFFPHRGGPQTAGVTEEALRFNAPLLLSPAAGPDASRSFFEILDPALVIDTLKKAEEDSALILRLYEARGTRGTARLTSTLPVTSARLVNLLEGELRPLDWQADGLLLDYKPFEIISLRMELDAPPAAANAK